MGDKGVLVLVELALMECNGLVANMMVERLVVHKLAAAVMQVWWVSKIKNFKIVYLYF